MALLTHEVGTSEGAIELLIREVETEMRRRRRRRLLLAVVVALTTLLGAIVFGGTVNGATSRPSVEASPRHDATAAGKAAFGDCEQLAQAFSQSGQSAWSVQAAFASTAKEVAAWEAARDGTGTGLFSSSPPSEVLSVCFLTQSPPAIQNQPVADGSQIAYGAYVMEIEPSGYAVVDVEVNGTRVPYGPPTTTSEVPTISRRPF